MQLDAGVNVMDALEAAGRASRSGLIRSAVRRAVPEVRSGAQPGPLLAVSGAFPEAVNHAIAVGEESGALDTELQRLAADYQADGLTRLDTLAEWVPRMLMLAIFAYVGYGIVRFYLGYLQQVQDITNQIEKVL
jgi:type IV pilus assembly protein PilC